MQQTVAILLNEREPQKKEIAATLEAELKAEGITSSRISSSPSLAEQVIAARPSVVVTDYILEDYGTGLDILEVCRTTETIHRPTCVFLTDEPSLQVAIAAMKLGAVDYLLTTDVHALSECVTIIRSKLADLRQATKYRKSLRTIRSKKELVVSSEVMSKLQESLLTELEKGKEMILLCGPTGVGKRTLARGAIQSLGRLPLAIEVDRECSSLTSMLGRAIATFEMYEDEDSQPALILENLSLANTGMAEELSREIKTLSERLGQAPYPLFMTTNDPRTAEQFSKHFDAFIAPVPALSEGREGEIGQLVQKFLFEASTIFKIEVPKLSAKELAWFGEQNWEENLAQLKRIIESFIAGQNIVRGEGPREKLDRILEIDRSILMSKPHLEALRKDSLSLFETLISAKGDVGQCARLLDCSIGEVYQLLTEGRNGAHEVGSSPSALNRTNEA
ncbi:MAG: hypothetical protein KDD70_03825 [Bdellovibrionales bacterium]|nr:hypothetical protein [Bdellovibrionales bacterium]